MTWVLTVLSVLAWSAGVSWSIGPMAAASAQSGPAGKALQAQFPALFVALDKRPMLTGGSPKAAEDAASAAAVLPPSERMLRETTPAAAAFPEAPAAVATAAAQARAPPFPA